MSRRRLYIAITVPLTAVVILLLALSVLGIGGAEFEDRLHNIAQVAMGLGAAGATGLAGVRSRGKRRVSWFFWSAYAVLEAFSNWNALATHTSTAFPRWADLVILAQLPLGLVAAIVFMRVRAPRLAVTVAYCDGLLMGGAVLVIGLVSGYNSFLDGRMPILMSMFSLAKPITDVVVLTLMAAVTARVGRKTRPIGVLLAAAMVGIAISDGQVAHQIGLGLSAPGSVFTNGWIAGLACLGSAALYALCFRRQPVTALADTTRSRSVLWISILPVALATGIGIALRAQDAQIARALVWVLLVSIGLILIRMYLALYMNLGLGRALEHQAEHDSLTGLPNRTLLLRRLDRALAAIDRSNQHVTLMMLDLDGFKEVNDTFGHSDGDQVLVQVARRVVTSVRAVELGRATGWR